MAFDSVTAKPITEVLTFIAYKNNKSVALEAQRNLDKQLKNGHG